MTDVGNCIRNVRKTVHITLPACYISNEIAGIKDIFASWKKQYVNQLQGVVVNYNDVSLQSKFGIIQGNRSQVHYDVTANFELFCPTVGEMTCGKINRISKKHVGCLIEETINATIYLHHNSPAVLSQYLTLGQVIVFKITEFDFYRSMIRVNGEITDDCMTLTKQLYPLKTSHVHYDDDLTTEADLSFLQKRNNSKPFEEIHTPILDSCSDSNSTNDSEKINFIKTEISSSQSESDIGKKKKKKKSTEKSPSKNKRLKENSNHNHQSTSSMNFTLQELVNGHNHSPEQKLCIEDSIKTEVSSSQSETDTKKKKRKREFTDSSESLKTKKRHKTQNVSVKVEDIDGFLDVLSFIKKEQESPVKGSTESNKREHQSSLSDYSDSSKKSKKHKKKDKKKSKKKDKEKSKKDKSSKSGKVKSKKKVAIVPSGAVLKKSKKSKKSSKNSEKGQ